VARAILDTATYVDLQRAPKHRNAAWALNTINHASAHLSAVGKPALSTLGVMEIEAGFEEELRTAKRQAFLEAMLPMFEIIPYGTEEASLGGEIYAKLESKRQRIGVIDTGIAATAIVHGLAVHFQRRAFWPSARSGLLA
jgi:predicted nucleic acid-binding protein